MEDATGARRDRRAERRADTLREIVDAAWALAAERGLTGWPLKDVADAVGMRTPSLYVYFASKNALYDALFADGYRRLLERLDAMPRDGDPLNVLRRGTLAFFDFCVEDPARFQLLFLRTLPGFAPSPPSYAQAASVLDQLRDALVATGVTEPASVDLYTALVSGLASQQISNDPSGTRWRRLVAPSVELVVGSAAPGS